MAPIPDNDLEFSFFKSSGPGGQKKNKTESAVRLRHLPTGIEVIATQSRSQHRNRQLALDELERRLEARNRRRTPRVPTRPRAAAKAERLSEKRQLSEKKRLRKLPRDGD